MFTFNRIFKPPFIHILSILVIYSDLICNVWSSLLNFTSLLWFVALPPANNVSWPWVNPTPRSCCTKTKISDSHSSTETHPSHYRLGFTPIPGLSTKLKPQTVKLWFNALVAQCLVMLVVWFHEWLYRQRNHQSPGCKMDCDAISLWHSWLVVQDEHLWLFGEL